MLKTRTTITIDEDLLTKVKIRAVKEKVNMSVIIEKAVFEYMKTDNKEGDKKK